MAEARPLGGAEDPEVYLRKKGYLFGRVIGEGSYAKVKMTEFTAGGTKEKLACKIICKKRAPTDFIKKFLPRELEILQRLDHDNVIRMRNCFELGSKVFIMLELAEGGDLLDYIKMHGAQKDSDARKLFGDICSGIAYCHSIDVVHRDLKCENLLMTRARQIKVADFGFARFCTDPASGKRVLSRTYCGSAAYAAPEILQGTPYNPKMYDVWSMGCILFIIVCGSMPFDDTNVRKMLKSQLENKIHFPTRVKDNITELCKKLIMRMLEVDITKRATVDQCLRSDWLGTKDGTE